MEDVIVIVINVIQFKMKRFLSISFRHTHCLGFKNTLELHIPKRYLFLENIPLWIEKCPSDTILHNVTGNKRMTLLMMESKPRDYKKSSKEEAMKKQFYGMGTCLALFHRKSVELETAESVCQMSSRNEDL